jgi:hypothetical protein
MITEWLRRQICLFLHSHHKIKIIGITRMWGDAMMVHLECIRCGERLDTYIDLMETEELIYRSPVIEKMLVEEGWIKVIPV